MRRAERIHPWRLVRDGPIYRKVDNGHTHIPLEADAARDTAEDEAYSRSLAYAYFDRARTIRAAVAAIGAAGAAINRLAARRAVR